MGEEVMQGLALLMLLGNALCDLKSRQMLPLLTALGAVAGLGGRLWQQVPFLEILPGLGPGLCLLSLAFLSRGAVGAGDGLVVLALGLILSWEQVQGALMSALLLSAGWALFLLARHRRREESLPFLPFLLAGYLLCLFLERSAPAGLP